jgi:hypothetical protein
LSLFDKNKPWEPKYQQQHWDIQDQQRREDLTLQLGATWSSGQLTGFSGQGRQDTQLGWKQEEIQLDKDYWTFRQKYRQEDFQLGQQQHQLTVDQMGWNIQKAKELGAIQQENYKKNYEINLKLFDLQTQWTKQDFDKQEYRNNVQRDWQIEDFAVNREQFATTSGWQQEDMARAIRYSTGRERIDLKRQQARMLTQQSWQKEEMDKTEERADVQFGWSEQDLDTQRERWDIMRDLQREQMTLSYEYQEKMFEYQKRDIEFMKESMALEDKRNGLVVKHFDEETPLLEAQNELKTRIGEQQLDWGNQDLEIARGRAKVNETLIADQRLMTEAQQKYNAALERGYPWMEKYDCAFKSMANYSQRLLDNEKERLALYSTNPMCNALPGIPKGNDSTSDIPDLLDGVAPKAMGGPTTRPTYALLSEFGQQEYVVPEHGALVLKGGSTDNGQVTMLLGAILSAIQSGGGKIMVDADALRESGFVHVQDFSKAYN